MRFTKMGTVRSPLYYFSKVEYLLEDRHYLLDKALEGVATKVVDPLNEIYYFIKDFVFPHNVMKIDSLGREYCDPVEYLLHANFHILKEFVEKEEPFEVIDWFENEETLAIGDEIKELYDWWVYLRPNRVDPWGKEFHGKWFGPEHGKPGSTSGTSRWQLSEEYSHHLRECGAIQDEYDREDQENLERLVKLRVYLWT